MEHEREREREGESHPLHRICYTLVRVLFKNFLKYYTAQAMDLLTCYCSRPPRPRAILPKQPLKLPPPQPQLKLPPSPPASITRKSNLLLAFYSKSKTLDQTLKLFHLLLDRDTVTWNTVISACTRQGDYVSALRLFLRMLCSCCDQPDVITFKSVLKACTELGDFDLAMQMHAYIIKVQQLFWGNWDLVLDTTLIQLYLKTGFVENARQMFDRMPVRDVVAFTALMLGYTERGEYVEALRIFRYMAECSLPANEFAYSCILRACSGLSSAFEGTQVHAQIVKASLQSNVFVGTALVDMYAKCEMTDCAEMAFCDIPGPNVISWNALIARSISGEEALRLFSQMRVSNVSPDHATFGSVLRACRNLSLGLGKQIHGLVLKMMNGEMDVFVGGALFELYSNWRCMDDARRVFDGIPDPDIAAFNSAIQVLAQNGHETEAIRVFYEALELGKEPNEATLTALLAVIEDLNQGKQLHSLFIKLGFCDGSNAFVVIASSLVKMYSGLCSLDDAIRLFDRIHCRDVVLWTSMISGCSHNGESQQALKLYTHMLLEGFVELPNRFTFSSLLLACANLAAVEEGKQLHSQIIKLDPSINSDLFVASGLVDMYAKCGFIVEARQMFDKMPERDLVTWNAMITGLSKHGLVEEAIEIFEKLLDQPQIEPNHVSFVGVLSACSHGGLLEEGYRYFQSIEEPTIEHYACLIDMVGRAGQLEEAQKLLEEMPFEPNEVIWSTLLGACNIHGNIELGEHSANQLFRLNPEDPGAYIALSNLYATVGRWDDVKKIRKLMKDRGVKKKAGVSWLRINGRSHAFFAEKKEKQSIR